MLHRGRAWARRSACSTTRSPCWAGTRPRPQNLASALLNRSFIHLSRGDVRRARADLDWCRRVAADGGHDLIVPKALHNLGYCDLLAGDIPAALQLFTAAASAYRHGAPGNLPVLAVDKARALMAAGLAGEAAAELDEAMASFRRQRLDHDLAEAELARFGGRAGRRGAGRRAPLGGGRRAALPAAGQRGPRRTGRAHPAAGALVAPGRSGAGPTGSPRRPAEVAARLRGCGLDHDADLAELVAARALVAAGRLA